jgi:hypothetical protein
MEYFYEKCVLAGPLLCAIYEKTPDAVQARVEKIWNNLKRQPIPTVIGTDAQDYGLVDYGLVRHTVFEILESPFSIGGQNMSLLFASLEKGDGSLAFVGSSSYGPGISQCSCDESLPQDSTGFGLSNWAILCSDAATNDTVAQLEEYFESNLNVSTFADVWPARMICAFVASSSTHKLSSRNHSGWKIRPAEKFDGDNFNLIYVLLDSRSPPCRQQDRREH